MRTNIIERKKPNLDEIVDKRDIKISDGMVKDGLTDVYSKVHMGVCAEICAKDMKFSRQEQDDFAIESYNRSRKSWES